MQERNKVAVFIDQTGARLITLKNGFPAFTGRIQSHYESHPRYRGEGSNQARFGSDPYHGSNNEFHHNRKEEEQKKTWFKLLEEKLLPYQEILFIGPGEIKKEMHNYLLEQKEFQQRLILHQNSEKLSERQLLETARFFLLMHAGESVSQVPDKS
jgi:hypothetical protein